MYMLWYVSVLLCYVLFCSVLVCFCFLMRMLCYVMFVAFLFYFGLSIYSFAFLLSFLFPCIVFVMLMFCLFRFKRLQTVISRLSNCDPERNNEHAISQHSRKIWSLCLYCFLCSSHLLHMFIVIVMFWFSLFSMFCFHVWL